MQTIVVDVGYFAELIKKATLFEVVCGLHANGKSFMADDVIKVVKGGGDGGPSDCSES